MLVNNFDVDNATHNVFVEYDIDPIAYDLMDDLSDYLTEKLHEERGCNVDEYLMVGDAYTKLNRVVDKVVFQFGSIWLAQSEMEAIATFIDEHGAAWVASKGGYEMVRPK